MYQNNYTKKKYIYLKQKKKITCKKKIIQYLFLHL